MAIFVESILTDAVAVLAGKIISTCLPGASLLLLIIDNHQVSLWCIKCLIGFALLSLNPNCAWCEVSCPTGVHSYTAIEPKFCTDFSNTILLAAYYN